MFGIGHDHDLCRRLMGEFPSRKANRKKKGLQMPRRKIDDEPRSRAIDKRHQFSREIFQIPVMVELCSIQFADGLFGEGREVIAQHRFEFIFHHSFPCFVVEAENHHPRRLARRGA
jgi:hypothetical protein